jgi:hypothetical protein
MSCPLDIDLPKLPCELGRKRICRWWLTGEQYHYCMWSFIEQHDGGAYCETIAEQLNMARARAYQIETTAQRKVAQRLAQQERICLARLARNEP